MWEGEIRGGWLRRVFQRSAADAVGVRKLPFPHGVGRGRRLGLIRPPQSHPKIRSGQRIGVVEPLVYAADADGQRANLDFVYAAVERVREVARADGQVGTIVVAGEDGRWEARHAQRMLHDSDRDIRLAQPTFASFAEERQHRKVRLAAGFRIFAALGFSEGVAGHVTARDPEFPDTFWVNPFGMHCGQIKVSDLMRVDGLGNVVDGTRPVNVSAFAIHYQIHEARRDVVAAAHTHSIYGRAWSAVGRLLDPITQDACAFYEDHVIFDDTRVLITEANEGARLAKYLGPHKAAILRNHGLITVGQTVEEAVWWFVSMERCCQAQFLAEAVGVPLQIDPGNARAARAVNGTPFTGWFQCQPLWNKIIAEQPDLLG